MRVAIVNLTWGGLSGGYRKYLLKLVSLLINDPRVVKIHLFIPEETEIQIINHEAIILHRFPASNPIKAQKTLRSLLQEISPDVIFIPTSKHLGKTGIPVVSMLQNMEAPTTPIGGNTILESIKNIIRAHNTKQAMHRSDRVIAVSHYVKEFMLQKYGIAEDKIDTVFHGVDRFDEEPKQPQATKELEKFTLTVGSIRPYRGLEDIIEAMALQDEESRLPLVIAGKPDPDSTGYYEQMKALAKKLKVGRYLVWAGQLGAGELAWCYENCQAYIMTSRVEACPNSALEAMYYANFIISTDAKPMPEFFEDAALYYPVGDAEKLTAQLDHFHAMSDEKRKGYKALAKDRSREFTWEKTAIKTIDALCKCLS